MRIETADIIEKWYRTLGFPSKYDMEFYNALEGTEIDKSVNVYDYTEDDKSGCEALLSFLYMCEELSQRYEKAGISRGILLDTLSDIVRWTNTWSDIKKELYLGEIPWLKRHMSMKLFRLGRLQFCIDKAYENIPSKGISKGDDLISVHIPPADTFYKKDCELSLDEARAFFEEYFPQFEYKYFSCSSWLLDSVLCGILSEESNIIQFRSLFDVVAEHESMAIIRYVFAWDAKPEMIEQYECKTSLAGKVKERILSGGVFHESFGVIEK